MNFSPSMWFVIGVLTIIVFVLVWSLVANLIDWQDDRAKEKRLLKLLREQPKMTPEEADEQRKIRTSILSKLNKDLKKK